jgi:L-amino acid N-acyltransferase YncA
MADAASNDLGLRLRTASEADVPAMVDIHARAVRESCSTSYTPEQLEAWLGKPRAEAFAERVREGRVYVCCDDEGRVLGFGEGKGDTVSALYVDPC